MLLGAAVILTAGVGGTAVVRWPRLGIALQVLLPVTALVVMWWLSSADPRTPRWLAVGLTLLAGMMGYQVARLYCWLSRATARLLSWVRARAAAWRTSRSEAVQHRPA